METLHIQDQLELRGVAIKALKLLGEKKQKGQASVLVITGDLGAGKTTFIKILGEVLGVTEEITSPTFVVMKRYETGAEALFEILCHIDAYRIEDIDEMRPLRFSEVLNSENTLVCIEWGERVRELLPQHTLTLSFEITSDTQRTITFS